MNLADRIKNIVLAPKAEWPRIDAESSTPQSIYTGYVMILAAIGPLVAIVLTLGSGFGLAIVQYLISLAITFVLALIADALAPAFGGSRDLVRSLKLVAYSWTGVWLVAAIAPIVPLVGTLLSLAATIYAFYTFYVGATVLGRASADKALGYTIVFALAAIVLAWIAGAIVIRAIFGGPLMSMRGMWI